MHAGPTIATVGMSIQVPLAVALDIVWKRPEYMHNGKTVALMVLGGWYVLAGFVGINVAPRQKAPGFGQVWEPARARRG